MRRSLLGVRRRPVPTCFGRQAAEEYCSRRRPEPIQLRSGRGDVWITVGFVYADGVLAQVVLFAFRSEILYHRHDKELVAAMDTTLNTAAFLSGSSIDGLDWDYFSRRGAHMRKADWNSLAETRVTRAYLRNSMQLVKFEVRRGEVYSADKVLQPDLHDRTY